MIVVLFAATNFDAVHKLQHGKYRQIFENLPDCIKDVEIMEEVLQHYQISEEDTTYKLIDEDATISEFDRVYNEISEELHIANVQVPQHDIVVISVFAGHGILKLGTQTLVTNEYDKEEGFYELLDVEYKMRTLSELYTNGYIITIFACCRQLYDHKEMKDGKPKRVADRMKKFRKLKSVSDLKYDEKLRDEISKLDGEVQRQDSGAPEL